LEIGIRYGRKGKKTRMTGYKKVIIKFKFKIGLAVQTIPVCDRHPDIQTDTRQQ